MQRRSFFGILGGLVALLGFKSEAKTAPPTKLPVIKFKNRRISNLDEIFANAKVYEPAASKQEFREVVRAYLREEDVDILNIFPSWYRFDCPPRIAFNSNIVIFGEIILVRRKGEGAIWYYPCVESLQKPMTPDGFLLSSGEGSICDGDEAKIDERFRFLGFKPVV